MFTFYNRLAAKIFYYSMMIAKNLPRFATAGTFSRALLNLCMHYNNCMAKEKANMIWQFSQDCCARLQQTVETLGVDIDYRQDGYLVIAIDATEDDEIKKSITLLHAAGFVANHYVSAAQLQKLGIRNAHGARFDAHGAAAHPLKFRNAVLAHCLTKGLKYHSGQKVSAVTERGEHVVITLPHNQQLHADAVVLATNAYTALLSPFFCRSPTDNAVSWSDYHLCPAGASTSIKRALQLSITAMNMA